ncbi:MAG: PRC-barrel domain-containing protein [Rhodanobacter sp.]
MNAPHFFSAQTLLGDSIVNSQGDKLGDLKDVVLNLQTGAIAYAVLSFGGILGLGDKLFAVPWSAIRVDFENKCVVLNASKDRLKAAPGFDKDHWPDFADPGFVERVRTYYA